MKVVVQRVSQASVDVVNELGTIDPTFEPQQIGPGFMLLVGVSDEDGEDGWPTKSSTCAFLKTNRAK